MKRNPNLLTTSANRNLLQPTRDHRVRRRTEIRESIQKGKERSGSPDPERQGAIESKLTLQRSGSSRSGRSDRGQLVDLVVEDHAAEEAERVRARKEGGDYWNQQEQKHFVRVYGDAEGEVMREGFDPSKIPADHPPPEVAVSDDDTEDEDGRAGSSGRRIGYGSLNEESNVWSS